jgi:hypothetical protein
VSLTADQRLSGPLLKLNRAKFHIQNLDAALKEFSASNPYRIGTKTDPKTGETIYYLTSVDPVPPIISLLVGDALHNLRASLDHLAQQFYFVGSAADVVSPDVSFPIFEDAARYKPGVGGKVKGMRQDAIDFINATKPYHGGDDALWRIHKLNIIDKHRLVLAVHGAPVGTKVDVMELIRRGKANPAAGPVSMNFQMRFFNPKCPLKVGDELFATVGEPDKNMGFAFFVALHEPPIVDAQSVLLVLAELANAVDGILNRARPLLV